MFVFFFVRLNGLLFWMILVMLCFETSSNVSSDLFLKLVLFIFCIVIFHRIMSCKSDNVIYMLCIFKCTLLGGCQRSMIKLSNACACALKSMRQKARASDN